MGMNEFLLVVAVGGGIFAVLYAAFRGAAGDAGGEDGGYETPGVSAESAALAERRSALVRSIEEIEADYEAGNLSEADYQALRTRYDREYAALGEQLSVASSSAAAGEAPETRTAPTPRRSRMPAAVAWSAGVIIFVALAWLVMSQTVRPRAPSGSITGSLPGQEMGSAPAAPPMAEVEMRRLAELERMVAADSTDVEALVEVGHMYMAMQRYGDVTRVSMKALDLQPDNPEALTHLGMVLVSVDHMADAMGAFDRALEIDPDFGEALQFRGMVAFMGDDFATAVESWERYFEVVPVERQAPRLRAMLEMARGNLAGGQ